MLRFASGCAVLAARAIRAAFPVAASEWNGIVER